MNNTIEEQPRAKTGRRTLPWAVAALLLMLLASCTVPSVVPITQDGDDSAANAVADANAASKADTATGNGTLADAPEDNVGSDASSVDDETAAVDGELYDGMEVGFTDEGYPYRGSPDAPVTIYEYSDFQCPFCNRHFQETSPVLDDEYVRSGDVRVIFRDFPIQSLHPNAPVAHLAALCAADQGAAAYWQMNARIFETQAQWGQSSEPLAFVSELANEFNLDGEAIADCVESGEKDAMLTEAFEEARALNFNGTPSFRFVIEGTDDAYSLVGAQPATRFANVIDTMLAGELPQDATAQAEPQGEPEFPAWATAEGLAPNPDRPGYTIAGDPFKGDPEAAVVVIEFSDFQCPFCKQHAEATQPVLNEQYVDTGEVMWVFKHFPLGIHPQAPMAAVAAECAGEQEQFWTMHDLLFASVDEWSTNNPVPALTALGEELELDMDAYSACLDDTAMMELVQSDFQDGQGVVRGTPTFVVLAGGTGQLVPGALPAETFTQLLDEALAIAEAQ